jgi:ribose transport system substrate-binding protein
MKKFVAAVSVVMLVLMTSVMSFAAEGTIGLSVLTLQNPFFGVIADNVTSEAAKYGYDVIVVSAENDPGMQNNQVNDFIVKGVDAIILNPADSKAVAPSIKAADEAGIPVFTADIACLAEDCPVTTHVATDNYAGGRQAGKAMHEALNGQGKVAIVDYPEVESVILRTRGFNDELAELKSGIEVVGSWNGKGDKALGFNVTQELLQAHPDITGIFAINDPSGLGAYAALEIAKKTDQVTIVAFDGMPEGKKAIREGKIYADPIQFPDKIGQMTVQAIMKYFEGEEVEAELLIPTALYYQKDAENDPDAQ